jgi:hypothetical protein
MNEPVAEVFRPGDAVAWLYEARGGYAYSHWVPATVVRVGARKVTIDAQLLRGGTKRIAVDPVKLRIETRGV